MSLIKKLSLLFVTTLIVLILAVIFLLGTEKGLSITFNLASRFVPGLEIGTSSGTLKQIEFSHLSYRQPGIDIELKKPSWKLDFSCFRDSKVCIQSLQASEIFVEINTDKMASFDKPSADSTEPTTQISTPYPIILDSVQLGKTHVKMNGMEIDVEQFTTGVFWEKSKITINPTQADKINISLPKTEDGSEKVAVAPKMESPAETLAKLFEKPLLESLPDVLLPFDFIVESLQVKELHLQQADAEIQIFKDIQIIGKTELEKATLTKVSLDSPYGSLLLQGEVTMKEKWPVNVTASGMLQIELLTPQKAEVELSGAVFDELKLKISGSGTINAQLDGSVALAKGGMPFSLIVTSNKLQWPLHETMEYQIRESKLLLAGNMKHYRVTLDSLLDMQAYPSGKIQLSGQGDIQQLNIDTLNVVALKGSADLKGWVRYDDALKWDLALKVKGLNTEELLKKWPIFISGDVKTTGTFSDKEWHVDIPLIDIDGKLRKDNFTAQGKISAASGGTVTIPDLLIKMGNNRIRAKGTLAKEWNLDAEIQAPQLASFSAFVPGLSGSAQGKVRLEGSLEKPRIKTNLDLSAFALQDLKISKMKMTGNVTMEQQLTGEMEITLNRLQQGTVKVQDATLTLNGNETQHKLILNAKGDPLSSSLILNGSFDRSKQSWQGNLERSTLNTPIGEWKPSNAIPITYAHQSQEVTIGKHCWQNTDAELCVPQTIKIGEAGQVELILKRFDTKMFRKELRKQGINIQGVFSGNTEVKWDTKGTIPQGNLTLISRDFEFSQFVDGKRLRVKFDQINVKALLKEKSVELNWLFQIQENGYVQGNLLVSDPQNSKQLSGSLKVNQVSLLILKQLLQKDETILGILQGDMRFSGTLSSPQLHGKLGLNGVSARTSWLPLNIDSGDVNLDFFGTRSTLGGKIVTGSSSMILKGRADWSDMNHWTAHVDSQGDSVRIEIPPMIKLNASHEISLSASPAGIALNGKVKIPWASILVEGLPESAVSVSSDEIMLDEMMKPMEKKAKSLPITTNLIISIGPDVSVNAFGLKAKLGSDLRIHQDRKGFGLHGEVNVLSGSFQAYGQDLLVRDGKIIFSGPADKPQLNIEVIRNPEATEDNVIAGLRLSGTAEAPKTVIFSEPALSQEEALSYLLRGQNLNASSDDSAVMTSILVGLGVAQSGKLVGKIGETFGIQNLTLDTAGVGDRSQVVVSGYILPRLQVKYGVGIFDSLATFTLRYRLLPRLFLEAVSGLDQTVDLLYQFEF